LQKGPLKKKKNGDIGPEATFPSFENKKPGVTYYLLQEIRTDAGRMVERGVGEKSD